MTSVILVQRSYNLSKTSENKPTERGHCVDS